MAINISESCAISLLRIISMCTIVACHILQGYGNPYCYLFNIGVQVFLAMSGYLYGYKTISSWKSCFVTRLKKLYITYLSLLFLCIPFYYCCANSEIDLIKIVFYIFDLQGIFTFARISGLGHLWFMSAIAICYLSTPLLQYLRKFSFTLPLLLITSTLEFCLIRFAEWQFSWLLVYALGYLYASGSKHDRIIIICFISILFSCSLILVSWDDILHNGLWNRWLHVTSGVLAVVLITALAKYLDFSSGKRILSTIDRYSYEVYITHQILILGPFSILYLSEYHFVNVLLILVLTSLMAYMLHKISNKLIHIRISKFR